MIAILSVMALSLFGGIGGYWFQKMGNSDSNIEDLVEEDSTVEVIAKADRIQKKAKNKKKINTTTAEKNIIEKENKVQKNQKENKGEGVLTEKARRPEDAIPPSTPSKNAANSSKNSGTKNSNKEKVTNKNQSKNKSTNQNRKTINKNNSGSKNKGKSQPYNGQIKGDMIYVEGFGWVKYSGGGSIVHEAPNAGTGEIIADM